MSENAKPVGFIDRENMADRVKRKKRKRTRVKKPKARG